MADERLSNVIGAPFPEHVLTQLEIRAFHNSTGKGAFPTRPNNDILFLANKSAWVRLTSSVRLKPNEGSTVESYYGGLNLGTTYNKLGDDLAKNWVLEAGTSKSNGGGINLRSGIGPDGAYGLGGTEELGYRPMPGLTSVLVDTKGTLGSLREAVINFKVWNMNQLNVIEALYFRLGYSMLLEWGHTQFFANTGNFFGSFTTNIGGIDAFQNYRKEVLQQEIAKLARQYSGNYDGMLGVVTNFNWSFNQDGGYDCTVKLIGLGAIIDSLRINLSFKMPDVIFQDYTFQQKTLEQVNEQNQARLKKLQEDQRRKDLNLPPLPPIPSNPQEIYTGPFKSDLGEGNTVLTQQQFLLNNSIYPSYADGEETVNNVPDYFYKAEQNSNQQFVNELNSKVTGLFLNKNQKRSEWSLITADASITSYQPVSVKANVINDNTLWYYKTGNRLFNNAQVGNAESSFKAELPFNTYITDLLGSQTIYFPFRGIVSDFARDSNAKTNLAKYLDNLLSSDQFRNKPLTESIILGFVYYAPVFTIGNVVQKKPFYFFLKFVANNILFEASELVKAIDDWVSSTNPLLNVTLVQSNTFVNRNFSNVGALNTEVKFNDVTLVGDIDNITVPGKGSPKFQVIFNNTAYIDKVLPKPLALGPAIPQQAQTAITGDNSGEINITNTVQTDSPQRFASALHAVLAAIKSQVQYNFRNAKESQGVVQDSLVNLTNNFYVDTVFSGLINEPATPKPTEFNLKKYALKGFNSNLMTNNEIYDLVPSVDFEELCQAYGIRYKIEEDLGISNYQIYIKFGYLLAFLNSMCLIYDSTQDTDKHPYVYLDFNPKTNFCLTLPQQLSIDPMVCMIPFQGTQEDYLKIFPKSIPELFPVYGVQAFGPNVNAVSSYLNSFKTEENLYQGKTMEILLNVDFLTKTLNQYTTQDSKHSINLKGFLDAIVTNVNKSLGDLNLFRVAYRDDTNTVIIKDDQFVPPYGGEAYMLYRNKYLANNIGNKPKYGQIPVFGAQSLVREMEFKTNLTTNISNIIAISAQANTGSANSSDYSQFSYLNVGSGSVNFEDAYKPRISDSSTSIKVQSSNQTGSIANDINLAIQFNQHVLSMYYGAEYVSLKRIDTSINYYIDRIANIKATDRITVAAPFIPANLSITIDGVSGIVMGNAFTIPEDRLPLSLRGTADQTKVGFIVVGLTHTIDQNQWLTKIRGQMIRLRDNVLYKAPEKLVKIATAFPNLVATVDLSNLNLNQDWVNIAFRFISQKEGFISQAKFDINAYRGGYGSDTLVTENGNVVKVSSTTVFTPQDAERTLKYNITGPYRTAVVAEIGEIRWNALNDRQKAALVSYVYNAGGGALRTWDIARAIQINSPATEVAKLIQRGPITAGGVVLNALIERRKQEAALYLS